jgi:multiple sugar transport system substrate-binding protein
MKAIHKKLPAALAIAAAGILGLGSGAAQAQGKTITLCWAAWDPANALVELSKDFTAKTKVNMKFEFVPWPNFADRMLNELNSKGKLCDLIIGDSQWIGGAAESGHYVKLNDFFAKEGIKMSDFMPAAVTGYSEWPKGTPNYWALPAMGDALGWTYRKDWFAKPELQASSRASTSVTSRRPRPGPSSRRSPSSSRASRSTARRSTARTSSPSAAPKVSPWA